MVSKIARALGLRSASTRHLLVVFGTLSILGATNPATALPFRMVTEPDPGVGGAGFFREFATRSDLYNFNQTGVSPPFFDPGGSGVSIAGLTHDGERYLMITEPDPGVGGPTFIRQFETLSDLYNLNQTDISQAFFDIGGSGVSIGGLTYDGERYLMITEPDPGVGGAGFIRIFDTLADLMTLNQTGISPAFSDPGGSGVSIAGLAFYDGTYFMVTEPDPGVGGPGFIREFDSLTDLLNLNQTGLSPPFFDPAGSGVSIGGLTADFVASLPEPGSLALFGVGLTGLGLAARRSKRKAASA